MSRIGSLVLSVTAVIGALCIVATAGAAVFDVKPLIFRSGSMSPSIETGALAIARTTGTNDLQVGDVVSVMSSNGSRITHRIKSITPSDQGASLVLKGDANATVDAQPYEVSSVERVIFDVPRLGYAVSWVSGPGGLHLGLVVVGTALLVIVWSSRGQGRVKARHAAAMVVILGTSAAVAPATHPQSTLASFTDTPTLTSPVSTYKVPKPVKVSCTVAGLTQKTATIVWAEVSAPSALTYTAVINETGTPLTVTDNGTTRQAQFKASLLSTVLNRTYNIRITAALPAPNGTWTSVSLNQPVTVTLLGLGMSCGTAS